MADDVAITAGAGTSIATDQIGAGHHYQRVKITDGTADSEVHLMIVAEDQASADGDTGIIAMARRSDGPSTSSGANGDYEALAVSGGKLWVAPLGFPVTVSIDITRPADTTLYTAGDALSDSTTAPTSGGFTFTSIARKSGGSVMITDLRVSTSADATTRIAGELWLFNQAVTNINDNSAFAVSDSEIKTCVAVIPFSLFDAGNNGFAHISGLCSLCTCVGSANLRALVRVRNGYTPVSAEVLTFTLSGTQVD